MRSDKTPPIELAIDHAGGVPSMAEACGVSFQAVYKWVKKGYPPVDRCEAVETASGGKVSKFDLLPPSFGNKTRRDASARSTDKQDSLTPRHPPKPPS